MQTRFSDLTKKYMTKFNVLYRDLVGLLFKQRISSELKILYCNPRSNIRTITDDRLFPNS